MASKPSASGTTDVCSPLTTSSLTTSSFYLNFIAMAEVPFDSICGGVRVAAVRGSASTPEVRNSCWTIVTPVRFPEQRTMRPETISCMGATLRSRTGQAMESSTFKPTGNWRPGSKRMPPLDRSS